MPISKRFQFLASIANVSVEVLMSEGCRPTYPIDISLLHAIWFVPQGHCLVAHTKKLQSKNGNMNRKRPSAFQTLHLLILSLAEVFPWRISHCKSTSLCIRERHIQDTGIDLLEEQKFWRIFPSIQENEEIYAHTLYPFNAWLQWQHLAQHDMISPRFPTSIAFTIDCLETDGILDSPWLWVSQRRLLTLLESRVLDIWRPSPNLRPHTV